MKMDPEIELMYVATEGEFVPRSRCRIVVSKQYNRKTLTPAYRSSIDTIWEERRSLNGKLFNGTKFRVASVFKDPVDHFTVMQIGVTCYKDFLGTNWSPNAKELSDMGVTDHGDCHIYMSDALGVGALVRTSDSHVILLRRSQYCGEAPGLWDVPGGHAEPEEIVGKLDMRDLDPDAMSAEAVREEIYNSILREVTDEVNIPLSALSDPQLMGVARNMTSAGRPSLEFLIRCSLSSAEVLSRYKEGTQSEAEESTNIQLLPEADALRLQTENPDLWGNIAPSAKGCLTLYRQSVDAAV